jgi:transcription-repair coupling factor (superfamily II helicase)
LVFFDLGLVIVDEEHRFGVGDKEKLKLLKSNTDFLTLTATPIPRTLQLAFLGIKPLSLIQTAPPDRQSVQTLLIREDWETIQSAIKREIKRNGQVFYIYNRVIDIEIMAAKIKEVVPEAKLVIAHGQLNEKDLEKRIQGFYDKQYDILLATTIVESGIDIPIANTMIIHNAHTYGLAQLHQLRGRIGRSNTKAFCYFVIPDQHKLSELSNKRLDALQKYCDIGAGFALANSDLEIRGAGELLGAEQSGHIQSIGLELYLSLLDEAMKEIKGETSEFNQAIDVSLGLSCYIPQNYIQEEGARIKFYKKLANATDQTQLMQIEEEIFDIYGPIPEFVSNLILTLKIRLLIKPLCLKHISLTKSALLLRFDTNTLEKKPQLSQSLIQYFMSKPKLFRFHGPSQVDYKPQQELTPKSVLDFCQNLKDQLITT